MMEIMNHGELSSHREDKVYSRIMKKNIFININMLINTYSSREYFFSSREKAKVAENNHKNDFVKGAIC